MTHLDFEQLNDLLDHRVSAADRPRIDEHLAHCAACREQYRRLSRLVGDAGALPDEVLPPPELWTTIQSRMQPSRAPAVRRWQLAAAAVVLIALSSAITARLVRRPVIVVRQEAARAAAVARPLPPPARSVDADYASTVQQLSETLAQRRRRLNPATVAKVEASLRVIDAALAEARAALAADPANRDLLDLVAATYRQKVDLLRRANELPSST